MYDESHCVLAVLTSRHVLNVLRVAHRPDLATIAQQQYNASDSADRVLLVPPPPASAAPVSVTQPLQSSLSLSWSSSTPPAVAVSCQSSPCLFDFPTGAWHDAVTVSSAVHQPVTVHLVARVKLSNDHISCVSPCRDGFLLGTAGGFVQRVALDGRPVSCMHAVMSVEQQKQQQATVAAVTNSGTSLAVRALCICHPPAHSSIRFKDGRVGSAMSDCYSRPPLPTDSGGPSSSSRSSKAASRLVGCQQSAAVTSDVAVCVAVDDKSRRLAVGWERSLSLTQQRTTSRTAATAQVSSTTSLSLSYLELTVYQSVLLIQAVAVSSYMR